MTRPLLALALLLLQLSGGAAAAEGPPAAAALDEDYRKLETMVSPVRARNVSWYAMRSATGIDEGTFVTVGGIEQWITIRGEDRSNPVLLFLHGGPGDVTNPWSFALFAPWQRHFTIVQWDQRGAGRTLAKGGPAIVSTLSLQRLVDDGIELTEHLRKHLGKEKIILVGHSFGSITGVLMARSRPDLFHAYVGTAQLADGSKNYGAAYDALLNKARALEHKEALAELTEVGRPPYKSGAGYGVQRKWSNRFEDADRFVYGTIGLTLVAPGNSVQDVTDSLEGQRVSAERLAAQILKLQPQDLGLEFSIPMFVFQGNEDFTTPTALAKAYLSSIKAPRKAFVPIDGGGHFAVFIKSERFLQELIERVRPLAKD